MIILLGFLLGCENSKKDGIGSEAPFTVSFKDNYLSVKAERIPLGNVLEELGSKADLKIYIDSAAKKDLVSIEFKNLLLEEGIRRILQGRNYSLTYAQPSLSDSNSASSQVIIGIRVFQSDSAHSAKLVAAINRNNEEGKRPLEEVMRESSGSYDPLKRAAALRELGGHSEESKAITAIAASLRDDDVNVRRVALEVLEETGEQMPVDSIVRAALNDPSPGLRMNALELLVNIDEGAAEAALKKALRDPDARVRKMAEGMLKELQGAD